jgi:ATP-dependent Clp protease adapter protein ClpS
MAILILVTVCLIVGFLMYLPFLLWFRRRRSRGEPVGEPIRYTLSGYLMLFAMLAVMVGGLAAPNIAPQSRLASEIQSEHGEARWIFFVGMVFSFAEMVLRQARVVLREEPPPADSQPAVELRAIAWWRRPWKVATVRGVPVFIRPLFPMGGLMVAFFAKAGPLETAVYCLAFAALILVHELGHLVAARALGLRVFAINITAWGGSCLTQLPRGVRDTMALFSGGLVAQAALLAITVAVVAVTGYPESPMGKCVLVTFTVVNFILAVVNLVPGKLANDLSNDGAILWGLLLHALGRGPHPLARQHAASPVFAPETRLTTIDGMMPPNFRVGVELLNDDKTPMEFVVAALEKHLGLDHEAAVAAMLRIHAQGGLLFSLADAAHADEVARIVTQEARDQGFPLICRSVEALPA